MRYVKQSAGSAAQLLMRPACWQHRRLTCALVVQISVISQRASKQFLSKLFQTSLQHSTTTARDMIEPWLNPFQYTWVLSSYCYNSAIILAGAICLHFSCDMNNISHSPKPPNLSFDRLSMVLIQLGPEPRRDYRHYPNTYNTCIQILIYNPILYD